MRRVVLLATDENANLASPSVDLAHPERNASEAIDLEAHENRFVEMKAQHDAEKDVKINLKMVGKLVSVYYSKRK